MSTKPEKMILIATIGSVEGDGIMVQASREGVHLLVFRGGDSASKEGQARIRSTLSDTRITELAAALALARTTSQKIRRDEAPPVPT